MADPYTAVNLDAPPPGPPQPYTVQLDAFPPAPPADVPHGVVIEATPQQPCRLTPDADLVISDLYGRNPGALHAGKEGTITHAVRLTVPNGHAASVYVEPLAA